MVFADADVALRIEVYSHVTIGTGAIVMSEEQKQQQSLDAGAVAAAVAAVQDAYPEADGNPARASRRSSSGATRGSKAAAAAAAADAGVPASEDESGPPVTLKVSYKREKLKVTLPSSVTVARLRQELYQLTQVPPGMQKLLVKGKLPDDTARLSASTCFKDGASVMLVGTTLGEAASVAKPSAAELAASPTPTLQQASIQDETVHKKVLEKGVPDGAIVGDSVNIEPLPAEGLKNLYKSGGEKCRLTFKNDMKQLWIGTAAHTSKVPYASISDIQSEAIRGKAGYHIVSMTIGTGSNSKYYFYYVPAQYVEAIKQTILGSSFLF